MVKPKKVHIIGICGKATAPLAKMFKDLGWQVSGSDQGFYPPASDYLTKQQIVVKTPYQVSNLPPDVDLVVVGGNALIVDSQNPEYLSAQELGLKLISYPEALREYVVKETSAVVVGTYGKTTISSLLSWVLDVAGLNPSFMVGGHPGNFPDGVRATSGKISVLEGDEHPTLNYSPQPKFMYYEPTHVILTAAEWDHYNVFKTEEMYLQAFEELLRVLPADGLLLACAEGKNVEKLIPLAPCRVLRYGVKGDLDYRANEVKFATERTRMQVVFKDEKIGLTTELFGQHNVQNVVGAVGMARELNVSIDKIQQAMASFKNLRQHLEVLGVFGGKTLIRDFAPSPVKARSTLEALRTRYKKNRVFCVFDLHSSSLREREVLSKFDGVFDEASIVLLPKVMVRADTPKKQRVTGKDILAAIGKTHHHVLYRPNDEEIIDYLAQEASEDDVIVLMSSGGLRGMAEKLMRRL